jgi:hypothetical protein
MSRVLPSQVVALIDRSFPGWQANPQFPIYSGSAGVLSAIVSLANKIPDELITISGDDYTDLVHGLGALTHAVARWNARGGDDPPAWIRSKSPVAIVREALAKCPDENPAPATVELTFIGDEPLRKSIRMDLSNATNALHNGDWKSCTVLAGAAVEAMLLWIIQDDPGGLASATKPSTPPERWDLVDLIRGAREMNCITEATASQANLARDFRNLIHPGRAQRTGTVCDRGTALSALAATELVVRDLR